MSPTRRPWKRLRPEERMPGEGGGGRTHLPTPFHRCFRRSRPCWNLRREALTLPRLPGQQHSHPVGTGGCAGVCSLLCVRLLSNLCDSGARASRPSPPGVLQTAHARLFLPAWPVPPPGDWSLSVHTRPMCVHVRAFLRLTSCSEVTCTRPAGIRQTFLHNY